MQQVLGGDVRARLRHRRRRARWGGLFALGLVAGTAIGVTAYLRSGQPARPEGGILCRAAASLTADATLLQLSADPVAACADEWAAGRIEGSPGGAATGGAGVPPLVACIGTGGAIEVFPGEPGTCAQLGLDEAAASPDSAAVAVAALQDRIATEVNLACVPPAEVEAVLRQMLADAELSGWSIDATPDAATASCATVSINSVTRTLLIVARPR